MADLATEIANLNAQAAELLAKYNGAFDRLDEETQNKILELQNKAQELQTQIESLGFKFDDNGILVKEDGSEINVGNALKLGGKSLEEIQITGLPEPDFDSGWVAPTLGANAKLVFNHNFGVIPIVKLFAKVTLDGTFNSNEYNEDDILEVPINARDSGDALSATGMYGVYSTTEIKLLFHTYVGAIQSDGTMYGGFIKIKELRVLAWKGVSL